MLLGWAGHIVGYAVEYFYMLIFRKLFVFFKGEAFPELYIYRMIVLSQAASGGFCGTYHCDGYHISWYNTICNGLYISGNKELCDEYMGRYPVIFLSYDVRVKKSLEVYLKIVYS